VTLEELRRQADLAMWAWEGLERDVSDAEDEVWQARASGDAALERRWRECAERRQAVADRAWEQVELAEDAVAEAEYEAEYPEEAAAERAAAEQSAAAIRPRELFDRYVRNGTITPEFYELLTGVTAPTRRS
jgi:hypothetical protein